MKLKCANCGEVPDHWQYVDQMEKQPLKGGRGEACAVIKCKGRDHLEKKKKKCENFLIFLQNDSIM